MKLGSLQHHCANHPDRPASALCVECRRSICQECATQWDGINYCVQCLARRRKRSDQRSPVMGWIFTTIVTILLFFFAAQAMVWVSGFLAELL